MIRILLLSILFYESVAAQGALDEGQEHPWSQPQLENATSYEIEVGDGVLKIHSFSAPIDVGEDRLVNRRTMMFIVYESRVELDDAVSDEIDRIVNSMTVNES